MATRLQWLNARIGKADDGRRKVDPALHDEIRAKSKGGQSQRSLAREYGCSRRLITFILVPERLKANNYPGHWAKYYDTDKQRVSMRKHRAKLRLLNKIKP